MHQNTASLPAASTGTIAIGPKVNDGGFHMYVVVDPSTGATSYQPFIPYGQFQTFVAELSASTPDVYASVDVSLGDYLWFTASEGSIIIAEKDGITCDIRVFGKKSMTVKIVNGNKTEEAITFRLKPTLEKDGKRWPGLDPQVVLPPEKPKLHTNTVPPGV